MDVPQGAVETLKQWNQTSGEYQYTRLPTPRHFRLLKFTTAEPGEFLIELAVFPLDEAPSYRALSYTWGAAVAEDGDLIDNEPVKLRSVTLHGKKAIVTESLYDALDELSFAGVIGYVWIDALCIDQTNLAERASQVSLMGDVYGNAEEVIVYLGKDDSGLADVLWLRSHFLNLLDSMSWHIGLTVPHTEVCKKLGVSYDRWKEYWLSYSRFFRRRQWFSRLWVFQEAVLARSINARCAHTSINWDDVEGMFFVLLQQPYWLQVIARDPGRAMAPAVFRVGGLLAVQNCLRYGRDPESDFFRESRSGRVATPVEQWYLVLFILLMQTRRANMSDPRDAIYGILGVAYKFLSVTPETEFIPDYSTPTEELYRSVADKFLKHSPTLQLLSLANNANRSKDLNLPSWCPDFSQPMLHVPFIMRDTGPSHGWRGFDASLALLKDACPVSQPFVQIHNLELKLSGFLVDTVEEMSDGLEGFVQLERHIVQLIQFIAKQPTYTWTGQSMADVLWRTLITDTTNEQHPAPDSFSENFLNWLFTITSTDYQFHYETDATRVDNDYSTIRNVYPDLPPPEQRQYYWPAVTTVSEDREMINNSNLDLEDVVKKASDYVQRLAPNIISRQLMRTENGFLGITSTWIERGDEVWILERALVPFILRPEPSTGSYHLVADAYIHGIMDGEAFAHPALTSEFHPITLI